MTIMLVCMSILIAIIAFMGGNAMRFKPHKEHTIHVKPYHRDAMGIANRLSRMIQIPTVSYQEADRIDRRAFEDFKVLLEAQYPEVDRVCDKSFHGRTGILYRWKGKSSQSPVVLMSHYDVVPCDEALWTVEPFSGRIDDTYIWGRGTLDTKGTLCGIMEAAEALITNGFVPDNDIYLSFSGDEEISGDSAPAIVSFLESQGVRPQLVLDEGGAIVENIFPGVKGPVAVIGTGEKGYLDVVLRMTGQGGHSSAPPPSSLVGQLSKAIVTLEEKPYPSRMTPPIRDMFDTLGRHSSILYRLVFANLWFFKPLLMKLFTKKGGEMNALIRTTTAVTMMNGSKAFNVLPPHAEAGINFRLLPGDSVADVVDYVKATVKNPNITIDCIESREASAVSPVNSKAWTAVKTAIHETWEGVVVAPYLMLAASDSRHFCRISEHVLRFSAMPLSKEERGLIHGNDERIKIETIVKTVDFFENVIRTLNVT